MSLLLAFAAAVAQEPAGPVSSRTVEDIIAGYNAWTVTCDSPGPGIPPVACSTQSSDQTTTIRLRRTAAGLELSLGSRRCPDDVADARASLPADEVRYRRRRHDSERISRVYSRFVHLEDQLLRSCGAALIEPSPVYRYLPLLHSFLMQSDVVVGERR